MRAIRWGSWSVPRFLPAAVVIGGVAGAALVLAIIRGLEDDPTQPPVAGRSPAFAESPTEYSGRGWKFENYVTNLPELDLALAAQTQGTSSRLQIALVDIRSGETVALGSFGSNPFVRLRSNPLQLLVSDSTAGITPHRLLIFDLGNNVSLAAELLLPNRFGYHGFANAMYLSNDGQYAYLPERTIADRPECQGPLVSGPDCHEYFVRIVDLNSTADTRRVAVPGRCGVSTMTPVGADLLVLTCLDTATTATISIVSPSDGVSNAYTYEAPGEERYVSYATIVPIEDVRVLLRDGSLTSVTQNAPYRSLLPANLHVVWTERVDDARVLVGAAADDQSTTSDIFLIDLSAPRVVHEYSVPFGFLGATVLDPGRAVFLSRAGNYRMYDVDLRKGHVGEPKDLDSLPIAADAIIR